MRSAEKSFKLLKLALCILYLHKFSISCNFYTTAGGIAETLFFLGNQDYIQTNRKFSFLLILFRSFKVFSSFLYLHHTSSTDDQDINFAITTNIFQTNIFFENENFPSKK